MNKASIPAAEPDASLLAQSPPLIDAGQAAEIARDIYGVEGEFKLLSSERDANFHIRLSDGGQALLKITNGAEDRAVTEMQTMALTHLAAVDPSLPVQRIHPTRAGADWAVVTSRSGERHVARLMSWLEGHMLHAAQPGTGLDRAMGDLLARLARGLRGFFHAAGGHFLQWDIKHAGRLRPMLDAVEDAALHRRLTALLDRFEAEIAPRLPALRAQIVHNDLNPHNLLVDAPLATRPTGVIDFGDMVFTPLVCDLAIACSYPVGTGEGGIGRLAEMVAGYAAVTPLEDEELALLPDLIRLRHATTLTIAAWRARRYPENAPYILRNTYAARRGLAVLDEAGSEKTAQALRAAARDNKETAR